MYSGHYRVTFIGHSYVRDLDERHTELEVRNKMFTAKYIAVPGGTFRTYLHNLHYFEALKNTRPDIVVVILGGNDLKSEAGLSRNFSECSQFYRILRETVPSAIIIGSQVETRFYKPNNRFGCPTHRTWDALRRQFNRFLHGLPYHDLILELEGHLDSKGDYRDGIHLSSRGFKTYIDLILMTLSYCF